MKGDSQRGPACGKEHQRPRAHACAGNEAHAKAFIQCACGKGMERSSDGTGGGRKDCKLQSLSKRGHLFGTSRSHGSLCWFGFVRMNSRPDRGIVVEQLLAACQQPAVRRVVALCCASSYARVARPLVRAEAGRLSRDGHTVLAAPRDTSAIVGGRRWAAGSLALEATGSGLTLLPTLLLRLG